MTTLAAGVELEELVGRLTASRPIFHSEADLQLALAWQVHLLLPDVQVRLEYRPVGFTGREYLDVLVRGAHGATALELKYPTRALTLQLGDEAFQLRNHAAHDITRYDVVKDVARLERVVQAGGADDGVALVLTNDPGYWRESLRETVDKDLRLHEGRVLRGELGWSAGVGAGTSRGRELRHVLLGSYDLRWRPFSKVGGQEFRWLAIDVRKAPSSADRPGEGLG